MMQQRQVGFEASSQWHTSARLMFGSRAKLGASSSSQASAPLLLAQVICTEHFRGGSASQRTNGDKGRIRANVDVAGPPARRITHDNTRAHRPRPAMANHQCPTSAVAAECDTHRARQQACAQRYAHTARRGSVPACGHTVDELRRLQAYRKARQNTFMASAAADEGMRVLSDVPPELLSRPKVPYVVQSYRLDEQHQLHRVGSPDPTLRADRPPLVHAMPWGARHVRVSVPGRVGRQLRPDDVCGSNSAMLRRKRATSDESVSIYSHLRPGRSLPSHIANPKVRTACHMRAHTLAHAYRRFVLTACPPWRRATARGLAGCAPTRRRASPGAAVRPGAVPVPRPLARGQCAGGANAAGLQDALRRRGRARGGAAPVRGQLPPDLMRGAGEAVPPSRGAAGAALAAVATTQQPTIAEQGRAWA